MSRACVAPASCRLFRGRPAFGSEDEARAGVRTILPRAPGRGVRGRVGLLAGVDVEAQDCRYLNWLVAAEYGTKFPVG